MPGDKIFVACSGGPDSVALFYLLHFLRERWNLKLGLLHLNHGLRGRESDRDERFVRRLAKKFHVPLFSKKISFLKRVRGNGQSLEEAARKARYDFFVRTAKDRRFSKVALAHTQDDQAETVLMRVLQGTGLRGLSGIRSELKRGKLVFVRPLLDFSKKGILEFLRENQIPFCRDRSNQSERFIRNRIRLKLLPWLEKEFNPRVIPSLARLAVIVKEDNEMLAELEEAAWKRIFRRRLKARIYLDRNAFLKFPGPLQFRLIERALKKIDERSGLNFDLWKKIRPGLVKRYHRFSLPRDLDLFLTPCQLKICKKIHAS